MAASSKADPSRLAAYDVLKAVRLDDAYANLALPQVLAEHQLDGRDAAFTTELVSGTIRWQGTYDAIIDGDQHQRRPRPGPHRRRSDRLHQRRAAQGQRRRPRRLGGPRGTGSGDGPGRPRVDRLLPPALGGRGPP